MTGVIDIIPAVRHILPKFPELFNGHQAIDIRIRPFRFFRFSLRPHEQTDIFLITFAAGFLQNIFFAEPYHNPTDQPFPRE
jgi:hypothetical protein